MRSFMTKAGVLAAAIVMLSAGVASAEVVEVKVPFPFVVHGQTMPAGQYRVIDDNGVVEIKGERGTHANEFVLTAPAGGQDPKGNAPVLVFKKYEKQYRLADIWESASDGREVIRP